MYGVVPALLPLALLFAGLGQDIPVPESTADDPNATTIALVNLEDRLTVPVQIGTSGPHRFVIDTGAERTVISRELAGALKLKSGPSVNVTAMSGTSRVATVLIPSLQLDTIPPSGQITAPALNALHLGALGLLGIDTLQNHKVTIDFDAQTMAVVPSIKRKRAEKRVPGEIVVRAKSLLGQLIVTDAEFDGRPIRVVIDTGSPVSVGNSKLQRMIASRASSLQPLALTSATGGVVKTQYTRVDKVRVGSVEFAQLPIAFADVPPFKRFGLDDRPALLLGMSTMRNFRKVQIDFANRELRFLLPRADRMGHACTTTLNGTCYA